MSRYTEEIEWVLENNGNPVPCTIGVIFYQFTPGFDEALGYCEQSNFEFDVLDKNGFISIELRKMLTAKERAKIERIVKTIQEEWLVC